ncbi:MULTISPECIES: lysine--tRNA ligase [unclassified Fusibacter]|uniref:lysine--tRNA ligase n=1 Tax=unclassified Fusibacter TaxID=2624464 RepID=UPI0010112246|nr:MULTISPECIES: lysine--tRNA ligase [unclassified Fusibacter]MCK8060966.1 lysine--tRNA ligase [Fusibacter sp. A2]NPE23262.1 lysine--tRNA ligase [Fusibacter sp. A1]RXV59615.1 lysine--tRNA ligase [Fusibacter sp. A1]
MHWAQKAAQKLVEAHPNRETFVCASGISPSGSVHIGNFREIVTTYFVVRALQEMGKKTRFIFSWDDFDRFRKVPKGIDSSYEQYIGMPYSAIPDPHGCCASYAQHYEREFESTLKDFGVEVEFLYQTQQYKSGRYREGIHRALVRRMEIYDIIMGFKTQEASNEQRINYYPINLYCHNCQKDDTTVTAYDEGARVVYYRCACGHQGEQSVRTAENIKLIWKADWPMRWSEEEVVFEPGGSDHSAEGGSFAVSTVVAREIFDYQAPQYIAYEFIGIKGAGGKMSSSSGNTLTPRDLMDVYAPEVLLYIFSKYLPQAGFKIGMDEDVIKHHTEFERLYGKYTSGELDREDLKFVMHLSVLKDTPDRFAPFGQIANVLPLVAYDDEVCRGLLGSQMDGVCGQAYGDTCSRVTKWIASWSPERETRVNRAVNRAYYVTIDEKVKNSVKDMLKLISAQSSGDDWMQAVYDLTRSDDKKITKRRQNEMFETLYHLLISRNTGPRLPLLVQIIGPEKAFDLVSGCIRN